MRTALRVATAALLLAVARPLSGAEIAGVALPESVEAGGRELRLNGSALLMKLVFRVYVVALYLPAPAHDAEAVVGPDVPKVLILHFLRAVSRESLVSALERDFARNGGAQARRAGRQIGSLLAALRDMKDGDRLTFTYEPGGGSTIAMTDGASFAFEGKDFADAFLLLYVGPEPPRAELKRRLLGLT